MDRPSRSLSLVVARRLAARRHRRAVSSLSSFRRCFIRTSPFALSLFLSRRTQDLDDLPLRTKASAVGGNVTGACLLLHALPPCFYKMQPALLLACSYVIKHPRSLPSVRFRDV